jgi:hypothetical protein
MNNETGSGTMNDETLLSRIERATSPAMETPLEAVVARGRQIRRRRRATHVALGSTAAVILAAGIVVGPTLGHTPGASTAWAVDRTGPDTVNVTIKTLQDPSGLQSALHAAGVSATVTYGAGHCDYAPTSAPFTGKPFTQQAAGPGALDVVDIHPAALPAGTSLAIWIDTSGAKLGGRPTLTIQVVDEANPVCITPGPKHS